MVLYSSCLACRMSSRGLLFLLFRWMHSFIPAVCFPMFKKCLCGEELDLDKYCAAKQSLINPAKHVIDCLPFVLQQDWCRYGKGVLLALMAVETNTDSLQNKHPARGETAHTT